VYGLLGCKVTALCSVTRNGSVVALTVSRWLFLMYLPWKYKMYFRWCRLSCTWYIPSIVSSTLSTTSHSLKYLLNLHYPGVPLYTPMFSFAYIFSRCCLQYASVLQSGIIFQAVNRLLFFFIPEQKGPLLVVNVIRYGTHSQQPRIRSFCTSYARQTTAEAESVLRFSWTGFTGNVLSTIKWDLRSFGTLRSVEW